MREITVNNQQKHSAPSIQLHGNAVTVSQAYGWRTNTSV